MKKSTATLILVATLALGTLIGGSFGRGHGSVEEVVQTVPELVASDSALGFRYLAPDDVEVAFSDSGRALPVAEGENFIGRDAIVKSETITINIEADGRTEYKALMKQGDTIVYSWKTDGAIVYYDFHGHDDAFGTDFFTRYSDGDAASDSGSIVAAYNGEHGWYLRNRTNAPVRIELQVMGFFDQIVKIDL